MKRLRIDVDLHKNLKNDIEFNIGNSGVQFKTEISEVRLELRLAIQIELEIKY